MSKRKVDKQTPLVYSIKNYFALLNKRHEGVKTRDPISEKRKKFGGGGSRPPKQGNNSSLALKRGGMRIRVSGLKSKDRDTVRIKGRKSQIKFYEEDFFKGTGRVGLVNGNEAPRKRLKKTTRGVLPTFIGDGIEGSAP